MSSVSCLRWESNRLASPCARLLVMGLLCVSLGLWRVNCSGAAQPAVERPAVPANGAAVSPTNSDAMGGSASAPLAGYSGGWVTVADANGRPVLVPASGSIEDYYRWIEAQSRPADFSQSISAISAVGRVTTVYGGDEVASLLVEYRIDCPSVAPVEVALGLQGATLENEVTYTGTGRALYRRWDPAAGLIYEFSGALRHTLKIPVALPVVRQGATRRVAMPFPSALLSEMQLTVPDARVDAKLESSGRFVGVDLVRKARIRTVESAGNRSVLTVAPLNRAEVVAYTALDRGEQVAVLDSLTDAQLAVANGRLELDILQTIDPIQGSTSSLVADLPDGFQLESVEAIDGGVVLKSSPAVDGTDRLTLALGAPLTARLNLRWKLFMASPVPGRRLEVVGLSLLGARSQTGLLSVQAIDGLMLVPVESESLGVRPIPVGSTRRGTPADAVFRIDQQPSNAIFLVQAARPAFVCTPRYTGWMQGDRIHWRVELAIEVTRGSVTELDVAWAGASEQRWRLEEVAPIEVVDAADWSLDDRLSLILAAATRSRMSVWIEASRPVPAEEGSLSLPMVSLRDAAMLVGTVSLEPRPGSLVTFGAGDGATDVDLDDRQGGALLGVGLATQAQRLVPPEQTALKVYYQPVPTRIQWQSEISLLPDPAGLLVDEQLRVTIEGRGPRQLIFESSDKIEDGTVEVTQANGQPVLAFVEHVDRTEGSQVALKFAEPISGTLMVRRRYFRPRPERTAQLELGLLRPLEATNRGCRVLTEAFRGVAYQPDESVFKVVTRPVVTLQEQRVLELVADETPATLVVAATLVNEMNSPGADRVEACLVQATLGVASNTHLSIAWTWRPRQSSLGISLPPGLGLPTAAYWNRIPLDAARYRVEADGHLTVDLDDPRIVLDRSGTLSLKFVVPPKSEANWGVRRWEVDLPRLGTSWSERTTWLVELPASESVVHVSSGTQLVSDWKFLGWRFLRVPSREYLSSIFDPEVANSLLASAGNDRRLYVLAEAGPTGKLTLRTSHRALVTVLASVFSLAIVTAWARGKFTLTSFRALFALCVAGALLVSFPLAGEILWQPAALGGLLAVSAWMVDRRYAPRSRVAAKPDRSTLTRGPRGNSSLERPSVLPELPTRLQAPTQAYVGGSSGASGSRPSAGAP